MEYLLEGKKRCDFLYIGITNPDPELTADEATNPARSLPSSNPFTYFERLVMLRDSLIEEDIPKEQFDIVPFPINFPHRIKYYVPTNAVFFVTLYDEWGEDKIEKLTSLGLEVDVMWRRMMAQRLTTGAEVRQLIATDSKWEHLVPNAVTKLIRSHSLDKRLKTIYTSQK